MSAVSSDKAVEWEWFSDESYYGLWRVRRKGERFFNSGYHVTSASEAESLTELLNGLTAAPQGDGGVDEAIQDAVESLVNRLEGWAKAYPESMFHEPTAEERDWLHATKPGLMDCIAASMGRHIAACIASDIAELRAALASSGPQP